MCEFKLIYNLIRGIICFYLNNCMMYSDNFLKFGYFFDDK